MPITKATQNVITPNIVTTDTTQTITGIKTISINSTSPALTITQTGTGEAFRVEDASPDSTPFTISATGVVRLREATGESATVDSKTTIIRQDLNKALTYRVRFLPATNNDSTSFEFDPYILTPAIYRVIVSPAVTVQTTNDFNTYYGQYTPGTIGISVGYVTTNGVPSYTVNGATTVNNFTTLAFTGSGQPQGGVPASGYASIQGGSSLTLTLRGHTTADTASTFYGSDINVYFIAYQ
jgi:hypothetical protein